MDEHGEFYVIAANPQLWYNYWYPTEPAIRAMSSSIERPCCRF
jgi:hypothetical protein